MATYKPNNPDIPDGHTCNRCYKNSSKVGFATYHGWTSKTCNTCRHITANTPKHERRERIAIEINNYQKGIKC